MPTNLRSRFTFIGIIVVLCLMLIFPHPSRLTDPHLTFIQKTSLKPGIDMVGGASLIYEIQAAPGSKTDDLSTQVMQALKRRVDPNGVRNLVWRPEGSNRLEIQMPLSPEAAEAGEIKKTFDAASQALDATNIKTEDVTAAVEHLTGDARKAKLAALAMGCPTRTTLFAQLTDTYDQIQHFKQNPDKLSLPSLAAKLGPLEDNYSSLVAQIYPTNLTSMDYESILEEANSPDDATRLAGQGKLDDLHRLWEQYPARIAAMDQMEAKFKDYDAVRMAVTDSVALEHLLQGSGVLEFHILATPATTSTADLAAMDARLRPGGKGPLPEPGDTIRWMDVDKVSEFDRPGTPPETHEWNGKHYMPVLVTQEASMTKASALPWGLESAYPSRDENGGNAIGFKFDPAGEKLFGDLTTHWFNYTRSRGGQFQDAYADLAIVLDNKIISAPRILNPITGGSGIITGGNGGFAGADADYLINTLNAGSLPAQLSSEPISKTEVGPTIGADNLNRGLIACGFGLVVVAVFLICYYYVAGFVAFIAVCLNIMLILAVMAALSATFTLPSIAGIVLTVGTAVDANVLIFERLREEQHRGLPLKMALRNSYNTAHSAIIDSNMTSIITSVCLYMFGSEEVKGFGLTLIIGILASLFTALYVTKTVFALLIDRFGVTHLGSLPLSFPKWDKLLKPNWDWMGKAWIFYTFSIIMITTGMILFVVKVRQGQMMDIEFASGTSVQFELTHPMAQDDVRKLIDQASDEHPKELPSPSVVAVGTDQLHYQVVTPNIDRTAVKSAVLQAMGSDLKLQLASQFDDSQSDLLAARGKTVLPILDNAFSVNGFIPPAAADHVGGVALVLDHLSPPLSPDQIHARLDHTRLSSAGGEGSAEEVNYEVQAPTPEDKPTDFAVVIAWNPSVSFTADQQKWSEELASPVWQLARQAISSPPSFEQETNFDPEVAGEMQRDAFWRSPSPSPPSWFTSGSASATSPTAPPPSWPSSTTPSSPSPPSASPTT